MRDEGAVRHLVCVPARWIGAAWSGAERAIRPSPGATWRDEHAGMRDTMTNRPWLNETIPAFLVPDHAWEPDPPVECVCGDASDAMCAEHAELILELI